MSNRTRPHDSFRGNPIAVSVNGPALLHAAMDCLIAKDTAFAVVDPAKAEVVIELKMIPVEGDSGFIASFAIVRQKSDFDAHQAEFIGLHEPAELLMSSIRLVASKGDRLRAGVQTMALHAV